MLLFASRHDSVHWLPIKRRDKGISDFGGVSDSVSIRDLGYFSEWRLVKPAYGAGSYSRLLVLREYGRVASGYEGFAGNRLKRAARMAGVFGDVARG